MSAATKGQRDTRKENRSILNSPIVRCYPLPKNSENSAGAFGRCLAITNLMTHSGGVYEESLGTWGRRDPERGKGFALLF